MCAESRPGGDVAERRPFAHGMGGPSSTGVMGGWRRIRRWALIARRWALSIYASRRGGPNLTPH